MIVLGSGRKDLPEGRGDGPGRVQPFQPLLLPAVGEQDQGRKSPDAETPGQRGLRLHIDEDGPDPVAPIPRHRCHDGPLEPAGRRPGRLARHNGDAIADAAGQLFVEWGLRWVHIRPVG